MIYENHDFGSGNLHRIVRAGRWSLAASRTKHADRDEYDVTVGRFGNTWSATFVVAEDVASSARVHELKIERTRCDPEKFAAALRRGARR